MNAVLKREVVFFYGCIILGVVFLFALAGNAQAFYNPSDIILGNPVIQTLQKFYSQNLPLNNSTFQTHVSCGGGDQTKIGVGPTVSNITTCGQCQSLATCVGSSAGVSNVGYLWDAHSNQCGLGIDASASTISTCLAPPPPPPSGPIPTPCPTSGDRIELKNYISSAFNIHFSDSWTAPTLYDICTKLYETSGTKFDDYFRNDISGVSIVDAGIGGCSAMISKTIICGPNMWSATGNFIKYWMIHELSHKIKDFVGSVAAKDTLLDNDNMRLSDVGNTIRPDGHISSYPYAEHDVGPGCDTVWWVEEYADTMAHYLNPDVIDSPPLCALATTTNLIPYFSLPSPAHCQRANDVIGPYNPYCADTLGIWQNHSPICSLPPDIGQCKKTTMLQFFGSHAADAGQTCILESGGNPATENTGCSKCPVWDPADPNCYIFGTQEYSVGLFQLNLMAQCAALGLDDGISNFTKMGTYCTGGGLCWDVGTCQIQNPVALETCKQALGWNNPLKNAAEALRIAQTWGGFGPGAMGWAPWTGARVCGLVPHP